MSEALLANYERQMSARRMRTWQGVALLVICVALSAWAAEVRPLTLIEKIGNFTSYINRLFTLDSGARVWTDPAEWFWGLGKWLGLLGDTLLMAYVGTVAGSAIGFVFCFAASANLVKSKWICQAVKRLLEFNRTVPELVFALLFVYSFGLGPVPGVIAIAIHTIGAMGKLFSEVVENIDMKPVEGIAASGGSWVQQIRFAVLPQVQTNFISYTLLRFEVNVRAAAVIGFVGAGGIGDTLLNSIRRFYYSDVSAILLILVVTVMLIDYGTEKLRHFLLGAEAG
jgi:phosphonate transport system permease protein